MSSSKEMLSELCHTKDHTPHFPCFDLSFEVLSMLQSLQVMNTEYRTEIFSKMWTKKKDEVLKQNTMLSLTDVYHFVWKPIHEDCEAIISGLNSLKIKLSVVTSTFGGMDLDKITEQVKLLVKALSACRAYQNKKPVDEPSDESIRRVGLYNQLCDLRQSIATLNQLRDKLKLTTTDLSSSQVSEMCTLAVRPPICNSNCVLIYKRGGDDTVLCLLSVFWFLLFILQTMPTYLFFSSFSRFPCNYQLR